uniref:ATP synthase subunit a n=1 Tax=Goeldia sp. DPP-2018 TaxID=2136113 RepID=A0A2U8XDU7_9ARAC|nr:ATP synthase F0 subunit 6 [Goeldia sp. DPP-2018]
MMMSLFSVFDPTSFFGVYLNWIIIFVVVFFLPNNIFFTFSVYVSFWKMLYEMVKNVFFEIASSKFKIIILLSLVSFIYLCLVNIVGLFPFVFTGSAHLIMTLGLGLVMWMSFFLMGWLKDFKHSAAHLVPEGSPLMLSPLLVIIESVSHLIRPFTLSVRLAANMMAGHLIMGLLSMISMVSFSSLSVSLMMQTILLMLEFSVSVIQSFVFSILLLLYALEYYY